MTVSDVLKSIFLVYECLTIVIVGINLHQHPRDDNIVCQNIIWDCLFTLCVFHIFMMSLMMKYYVGGFILSSLIHIWPIRLYYRSDCQLEHVPLWNILTWETLNFYIYLSCLFILMLRRIVQTVRNNCCPENRRLIRPTEYHYRYHATANTVSSTTAIDPNIKIEPQQQQPMVTCGQCSGRGDMNCIVCQYGKIQCVSCGGRGSNRCTGCSSGYNSCTNCGGRGQTNYINFGTKQTAWHSCGMCCGSGKRKCYSCDYAGNIRCYGCGGMGYKQCYSCGGRGKCKCTHCQGSGKIHRR